ncbi:hypothetical protein ACFQX8_18425 [Klenkia terrae]|uniref:hypothetical protein n=1 Tax=Klenkia terrae TaxID=1052259 RepID=UPI003614590B
MTATPGSPPARPATKAPAAEVDGWPVTTAPGSAAPQRSGAAAAAPARPAADPPARPRVAAATDEPDIPLPPEPTDDEDWPQPSRPAAAATSAPTPAPASTPAPAARPEPRAAAESSPTPRGGEPMPLVSANPPEEEAAAGDGELTTADVRRIWPELMKVVRGRKRTTEGLMKSAQVHGLANGTLTMSFTSPALAKMMGDELNREIVRASLEELLGVRWKVATIVDAPGQPAAGAPPVAPEVARAAARAAESAEADELMAERAADTGSTEGAPPPVDPEQTALQLLRTQLGAHPIT